MFLEICAGVGLFILFGFIGFKLWEADKSLVINPDSLLADKIIEYYLGGKTHNLAIKRVMQVERNYVCVETVDGLVVSINSPEWRVVIKNGGDNR